MRAVTRREMLVLLAAALLALFGYLLASRVYYRTGFPLDDAWIHQTYARNLAQQGEWAFQPGERSAGSTAPLWTLVLSFGHLLRVGPYWWTYLAGGLLLFALGWLGGSIAGALLPDQAHLPLWSGIFLVLEWHLVWAAGSGMETLFLAALVLLVFAQLLVKQPRWFWLGLVVGVSVWVRPDGVTLFGPLCLGALVQGSAWQPRLVSLGKILGGVLLGVVPYALFNLWLAGTWLPNTFFAKQAEYAVYQQIPLVQRVLSLSVLPLVGAGVLLLPGFVALVWRAFSHRNWPVLGMVCWLLGYLLLYALRLPVTYQHGRYVIPAMPVYYVLGLSGTARWLKVAGQSLLQRVLRRSLLGALGVTAIIFYFVGMGAYARDVAIIESEMVETAHWLQVNTDPGDLVAAHDIGALGYFSERPILDLAGLVTPDVIPFIRDQERLAVFLDQRQAQYLVTFPSWYPILVDQGETVYQSTGMFAPASGGENMLVLRWSAPVR